MFSAKLCNNYAFFSSLRLDGLQDIACVVKGSGNCYHNKECTLQTKATLFIAGFVCKSQYKGDTRNHVLQDPCIYVVFWGPVYVVVHSRLLMPRATWRL